MTAERYQRIKRIFHVAIEAPEADRARLLDSDCGADTDLREEVERLLVDAKEAPGFLANSFVSADPSGDWIGIRLKDRYVIDELIAASELTRVYLAHDEQLHSRQVVIKRLSAGSGEDEWLRDKFRDEAAALTRIDHPGVVAVLDASEAPDGTPFLVLPYITGPTLRSVIDSGSLTPSRSERILRQICMALAAAHDRKVLHRDLKPENIVLRSTGPGEEQAVLIDFGLATFTKSHHTSQVTRIVGTLSYMAPEQFAGKVSNRSDIYSVGVIAHEMLGSRIPEPVRATLSKATAYDENDRYATVRELSEDLSRALSGRPTRSRRGAFIRLAAGLALAVLIVAAVFRSREAVSHVASLAGPAPFEVTSVEDTHVTERKGNADISHGGEDPDLAGAIGWRAYPMVRFDLAKFRGKRVVGLPTLNWLVHDVFGRVAQTHTVSIHTLSPEWHAATVTWNSFGPLKLPLSPQDYSPPRESRTITFRPGDTASFTLPASVLQTWMDTPEANFGVILICSTSAGENLVRFKAGGARLIFYTQDNGNR
jgi:hypothetical protein